MDYLKRFNGMVDKLKTYQDIIILNYNSFPPVSEARMKFIEEEFGKPIPEQIKNFYKETNGLQLRWIHKKDASYDPDKHKSVRKFSEWTVNNQMYEPLGGAIMLLPLEKIFVKPEYDTLPYFSEEDYGNVRIEFENASFPIPQYINEMLKPLDLFGGKYHAMALIYAPELNFPLMFNEFDEDLYRYSRTTDFASYLEMLIANSGAVKKRKELYFDEEGAGKSLLKTMQDYWTSDNIIDPASVYADVSFPLSEKEGHSTDNINHDLMKDLASSGEKVDQEELIEIHKQHKDFIDTGGSGGTWQFLSVAGMVLTIYFGAKGSKGEQATFTDKIISELNFTGLNFTYGNFARTIGYNVNFENCNLRHVAGVDSEFENSNFANADLQFADFSRSNMKNCNFKFADLSGADFENCDLTGSDFTGAKLSGSKFPGANLTDVKK